MEPLLTQPQTMNPLILQGMFEINEITIDFTTVTDFDMFDTPVANLRVDEDYRNDTNYILSIAQF